MESYDVVIVGAGPAGSAAARAAARGGARTLVVERRRTPGVPVQCGEFIPSVAELGRMFPRATRLADLFAPARTFTVNRTSVLRVYSPAERPYDVPFEGAVLERDRFEQAMVREAVEAGADVWTGTRVTEVTGAIVHTARGNVRARVVIGADGPTSIVARDACLGTQRHMAFGVQYLLKNVVCDSEVVEMYFGPVAHGGYAWVIPKGNGTANVGVGVRTDGPRAAVRRDVLEPFIRHVCRRSGGRVETGRLVAGLIPVGGPRAATVAGNTLLAGDAAGHLMPCNGGGIPTAMMCGRSAGEVAAAHVTCGTPLDEYERVWRRELGRELSRAVTTRRVFDVVTKSRTMTEWSMYVAGATGMRNLVMCRPWYCGGLHV